MQVCIRSDVPNILEYMNLSDVVLKDEYGHLIKDVSKVTFKFISNDFCLVTIDFPSEDPKDHKIYERSRTFILRGCRIDLLSIGQTKEQEKFHAGLETSCKKKVPWYVRVAMKVVDRFLTKQENMRT